MIAAKERVLHEGLPIIHALHLCVVNELRHQRQETLHLEMLSDLTEIVAAVRVQTLHAGDSGKEILEPAINSRSQGNITWFSRLERWIENNLGILQFNLHLKEWQHLVLGNDQWIQNLTKMLERHCN